MNDTLSVQNAQSPGLYGPLADDEIRLLSLEACSQTGSDGSSIIRCQIQSVRLGDLGPSSRRFEQEADRRWSSIEEPSHDFSTLFNPRRGLFDRPLKSYIKSLQATRNIDQPCKGFREAGSDLSDRYVALSYVWGDATLKRTILVNDVEIEVTENLHAALLELRKSDWVRRHLRLWVDALCINQKDLDERERQVRLMRDVYATAWQVVSWLGPATKATATAYTALLWLAQEMRSDDVLTKFANTYGLENSQTAGILTTPISMPWREEAYAALRSFFACTYWHRLWILQELAMAATDSPVLWGHHAIRLCDLWTACELIDGNESLFLYDLVKGNTDGGITTVDRRLNDRQGCPAQQWKHILRIKHLREQAEVGAGAVATASPALELARQAQATDQRDKVYGILGIPCVTQLSSISPNYRLGVSEVFTSFTLQIITRHGLDILRLIHSPVKSVILSPMDPNESHWLRKLLGHSQEVARACTHDLPSWVVCWSCVQAPGVPLPRKYTADNELLSPAPPRIHPKDNSLSLHAVFVDEIATLSAFNVLEADKTYPYNCEDALSLPNTYGDSDGLKDAFWRTIVADSTSDGEEPPTAWAMLASDGMWTRLHLTDGVGGGSGLHFDLFSFLGRNKKLVLNGVRLGDLIARRYSESVRANIPWPGVSRDTEGDERAALSWASNVLAWRRLIGTRGGRIGLTVAAAASGDSVVVIPGCSVPMVVRRRDGDDGWRVVGECFLYGMMEGEAAGMVRDGRACLEEIRLC